MTIKYLFNYTSLSRSQVIVAAGLLPFTALSNEVVLKATDGSPNLVGELLDYSDDNYVIKTTPGELRISAARVRCESEACPEFETATAEVVVAVSDTIGLGLMPPLLTGYASFPGAEYSDKATERECEILTNFVGDGGYGDKLGSYLVTPTTSGDAFSSLMKKSIQIGMASRRIRSEEARELKSDEAGNMVNPRQEHVLAVDSLVVIVNPENAVTSITMEQLHWRS